MSYSCIDAYEAIIIDLCKHDPALNQRFADSEDGEDQSRAAQWMLDSIAKTRNDRDALLAALKALHAAYGNNLERHGMDGDDTWTDADHAEWQEAAGATVIAIAQVEAVPS
jgi:hypothetical protein